MYRYLSVIINIILVVSVVVVVVVVVILVVVVVVVIFVVQVVVKLNAQAIEGSQFALYRPSVVSKLANYYKDLRMWNSQRGLELLWSFLPRTRHIFWTHKQIACTYFARKVPTQKGMNFNSRKFLNNDIYHGHTRRVQKKTELLL